MKLALALLALSLMTTTVALAPTANATDDSVCDDGDCLVSVEWYVCVTEPCDGLVVCLARSLVCTNDL